MKMKGLRTNRLWSYIWYNLVIYGVCLQKATNVLFRITCLRPDIRLREIYSHIYLFIYIYIYIYIYATSYRFEISVFSIGRITHKLERMLNEAVVAYFEVVSRHLS